MAARADPMRGEAVRIDEREPTRHIPGTPHRNITTFREGCPECDYFKDVEDWDG